MKLYRSETMKCKIMTLIIACCGSIHACGHPEPVLSEVAAATTPPGQFRGYEALSQVVKQRLLDSQHSATDRFELGVFLGTRDPQGLPALLGGFSGDGPTLAYRNGVPNAMNTAVWYLVGQRLSEQLASYCTNPHQTFGDQYALDVEVEGMVQALCAWPATSPSDLVHFWDRVMGAFAPDKERDLWLAYVETMRTLPADNDIGTTVVKAASETLFLHPYFLLAN